MCGTNGSAFPGWYVFISVLYRNSITIHLKHHVCHSTSIFSSVYSFTRLADLCWSRHHKTKAVKNRNVTSFRFPGIRDLKHCLLEMSCLVQGAKWKKAACRIKVSYLPHALAGPYFETSPALKYALPHVRDERRVYQIYTRYQCCFWESVFLFFFTAFFFKTFF